MNDEARERQAAAPAHGRPAYPLHKIVAAVDRAKVEGVITQLAAAGFPRDQIDVVTAEDGAGLDELSGGTGVRGLLRRLSLSVGDDLDAVEQMREELRFGHALVLVPVHDDAELVRVRDLLREDGGHAMRYFGRWTIASLDGDGEK
jgi:hypothetical protein